MAATRRGEREGGKGKSGIERKGGRMAAEIKYKVREMEESEGVVGGKEYQQKLSVPEVLLGIGICICVNTVVHFGY